MLAKELIKKIDNYNHVTLNTDYLRSNMQYSYYKDMNGKFRIESRDSNIKDAYTECDYAMVHFVLNMPKQLVGGNVNIFGNFTNQELNNKAYIMKWNFEKSRYEISLLLKQGYYNYQYVYIEDGKQKADETIIEGSFYCTENNYQIFVYYRKSNGGRYDQLIGFKELKTTY